MQELIELTHNLADEAGKIIRKYFRTSFDVERKDDETPVTIADKTVEKRIREILEDKRPQDGILGEEFGEKKSKSGLVWVIDPVDGTKSFVIGRPTFGSLIALWEGNTPLIGMIDQPILKERWLGVKGEPTRFNNEPVKTRSCTCLTHSVVTSTSPSQLPDLWEKMYSEFKMVAWGGDCYSYGILSCGWVDAVIEAGMNPYDYAALPPIVEGAGGAMFDWEGKPLTLESKGETIAIGDMALKDKILEFVNATDTR